MDDRLTILLAQLDGAWNIMDSRLTGRDWIADSTMRDEIDLSDQEFFWEPVDGCWSLRPRGESSSSRPIGAGEWVLDGKSPPPKPFPFTTIAWRVCHVAMTPIFRYEYTFGDHSLKREDIVWPTSAAEAFAFLRDAHLRWRNALETVSTADLDQVGRCQNPYGLDPRVRFVDLIAWCNTEFTHHGAEIGCVRDLYKHSILAQKGPKAPALPSSFGDFKRPGHERS